MNSERERVAEFWDRTIDAWLSGRESMPAPLPEWFASYTAAGAGAVVPEAVPEPWIGPLLGRPRMAVLGLNPGGADLRFQGRDGLFATEIRRFGFSGWAASAPYSRQQWTQVHGHNRYHHRRLAFARRFYADDTIGEGDVLAMELYPWHSSRVTGAIAVPTGVLEEMVWRPLAELDLAEVFAFGQPWVRVAENARLHLEDHLGRGGREWGSEVVGRQVLLYRLPSGQRLVVSHQSGYAGPPGPSDSHRLSELLRKPG